MITFISSFSFAHPTTINPHHLIHSNIQIIITLISNHHFFPSYFFSNLQFSRSSVEDSARFDEAVRVLEETRFLTPHSEQGTTPDDNDTIA